MNEPIVTIDYVERRAREAFLRGERIKDNPYPWNSAAHKTWNEAFEQAARQQTIRVAA